MNKFTTEDKHSLREAKFTPAQVVFCVILLLLGVILLINLIDEVFFNNIFNQDGHYDFLAFYSAAHLSLNGHITQIYNSTALTNFQRKIIPVPIGPMGYRVYLNPPFIAALLSPLGLFSESNARVIWLLINLALIAFVVAWLTKVFSGSKRLLAAFLLLTSVPVYQSLIQGQLTIVMLFFCTLAIIIYKKQKYLLSGMALSIL